LVMAAEFFLIPDPLPLSLIRTCAQLVIHHQKRSAQKICFGVRTFRSLRFGAYYSDKRSTVRVRRSKD
jgi:hypothetical protein